MDLDKNNELDQANLRVIVACCALVYMTVLGFLPGSSPAPYLPVIYYIVTFVLVSIGLRQAIARWPGNYPWRRVLGMVHDYTGTCFGLVVGGEAALPIYAVMVWVNLGNGMRFGSRYLAIATVLALAALLVVYQITPYWQANPFMVLMLLTTSTVIPVYAHLLLERTRKASEQAAAANREKSRFLAQASHDLRQPIHSIGLFTACLREAQLGEEERRLVDSIDRSLLNVSQLFRSILDLYTLDNGRVQPRSETFALAGFLAELVRQNTEPARWAGVEIRLRPCAYWTCTDRGMLTTMVQNVLSNCFKYAAHRPLLLAVRRCDEGLAIVVYDQGRGIDEAHQRLVFEEFYRVRQVRDNDVEGVGLGLSIVRRLGHLMGLKVKLRSRPGHGTAVSLQGLPRLSAQPALVVGERSPAAAGLLGGLRVCLVEDDHNVLRATSALLQRWGCEVEAHSSPAGLSSDCEVIVADYDLGQEATGVDCIDRLRAQRGWDVPALIMTGHDPEKIQAAVHERNIAVLSKPVRPAELRAALRALREEPAAPAL
ncbi:MULTISPECIES: ATP-binding response regulator [Pseudomonas]|uniref:histidine kinase n=2 Tax=Pseudomonas putida TaxID=303 RepID=A0A7V8EH52_PSEPU|nr:MULTISPECIES: hybrid sensor histidine kinase/response regulator [Pseudomonas]EKT4460157.1 hybrid sensor histidine kinase/response regulator [Pseudomonas putida]EKT4557834.1 hybrid sensor histidine kinase/response regulator [Pseudomonas putida]KAF0254710.1 response regulator [Pseudomonas putida]MBS5847213.1 hybrid sensor histidine kinase/response regulator [Pseudomonas putida]MCE0881249.1 hybrid sensor histidine kinase/response regulator [Pseudomonas putida]